MEVYVSTTTKFTPGPWFVFDHYCGRDPETAGEYADHRVVGLGQFDTVADVRHGHDDIAGDVDANAHLIAAAPELYEAALKTEAVLTALNAQTYVEPGALRALRDALAKARGEVVS